MSFSRLRYPEFLYGGDRVTKRPLQPDWDGCNAGRLPPATTGARPSEILRNASERWLA